MESITIFAGGYGSGKSEVALNFAFQKAQNVNNLVLADLDMVNPWFVSRGLKSILEERGIRLVAPGGELAFGDVPQIPADLINLLKQDNNMVIDLAGDESGALVMGYISKYVKARKNYDFYLVLNPYRPFTSTLDNVKELVDLLQMAAQSSFNGIISNPNLAEESDLDIIRAGHRRVLSYAEQLGLEVIYLMAEERFYDDLYEEYGEVLQKIKLHLRPDWIRG